MCTYLHIGALFKWDNYAPNAFQIENTMLIKFMSGPLDPQLISYYLFCHKLLIINIAHSPLTSNGNIK